jgi:ATP-binding cassette subfamily B protein
MFFGALAALFVWEVLRTKLYAKNERAEKSMADSSNSLTTEIIKSERDIKSLNLERQLRKVAEVNYGRQARRLQKKYTTNMYFWSSRGMAVQLVKATVLLIGVYWVRDTRLSIAAFLFIFTNRMSFENLIWRFGNTATEITSLKVATNRMFELLDPSKFAVEKFGDKDMDVVGAIEFDKVKFSYLDDIIVEDNEDKGLEQATTPNRNTVFDGISFAVQANSTVAFVGKSGSGKSTLLSLIAKLYDVDDGKVLIDGVDIQTLSEKTLRNSISLVNQFPYIFNTTIYDNIKMAKEDASTQDIEDAAKKASLHDFIMSLKNGYQTKVGEGGIKLSGGQRQRLAISRALLKKSRIILFDESTSSLDNATQEEIKESLSTLSGSHTVIIVAHRLSTIRNADTIFFVSDGCIQAQGTFETLMQTSPQFEALFKSERLS